MSEKEKKNAPQEEQPQANTTPETEQAAEKAAEEETFTVTREQMAAILYRYASYKGYDVTASADLSGYADQAQISGYALTAMQWANAEGLITGTSDSTLTPGGSATRAEAATILMRVAQSVAN